MLRHSQLQEGYGLGLEANTNVNRVEGPQASTPSFCSTSQRSSPGKKPQASCLFAQGLVSREHGALPGRERCPRLRNSNNKNLMVIIYCYYYSYYFYEIVLFLLLL